MSKLLKQENQMRRILLLSTLLTTASLMTVSAHAQQAIQPGNNRVERLKTTVPAEVLENYRVNACSFLQSPNQSQFFLQCRMEPAYPLDVATETSDIRTLTAPAENPETPDLETECLSCSSFLPVPTEDFRRLLPEERLILPEENPETPVTGDKMVEREKKEDLTSGGLASNDKNDSDSAIKDEFGNSTDISEVGNGMRRWGMDTQRVMGWKN
jgi:hypothetical protein